MEAVCRGPGSGRDDVRAIRSAADDAGLADIPHPDAVTVVALLSWRHGDPAFLIAEQLGLLPTHTALTTHGGNSRR